jgi:hypothetical protein
MAAVAGDPVNEARLVEARKIASSPAVVGRRGRSRVTNGKSLFVEHDGTGLWTRRFRDVLSIILRESVGANEPTETQRQDARRAATLICLCERLEGKVAAGEDIDGDQYGQLADRLGRIYRRLGLDASHDDDDKPKGGAFGRLLVEDYEQRRIEERMKREG